MDPEVKLVLGTAMGLAIFWTAWGLAANQARRRRDRTRTAETVEPRWRPARVRNQEGA